MQRGMIPGDVFVADGEIELNGGRRTVTVRVANTGDRPIQVGSHYHFFETNPALEFDRALARGFRLDIAAGTAVRFEPGQARTVALVALDGSRSVFGFRKSVMGALDGGRAGTASSPARPARASSAGAGRAATKARKPAGKSSGKASR